jgi:hypothetical protein
MSFVDELARSRASAAQALTARTDAALERMMDQLKQKCLAAATKQHQSATTVHLECMIELIPLSYGIQPALVKERIRTQFPTLVTALGIQLKPGVLKSKGLTSGFNVTHHYGNQFSVMCAVTWSHHGPISTRTL